MSVETFLQECLDTADVSESTPEQQIEGIRQHLEETDRLPIPTLEIIGEQQLEIHWQALLMYFLNEENSHGFGRDVLAAFLEAIESHPKTAFESRLRDVEHVDIQSEVPTGNGPVDLLLTLDDRWFICIELKVGSPETGNQTVRYAKAGSLGDIVVSEFEGEGEYLYLAPEGAPEPSSEEFVEISWRLIVNHIEDVLKDGYGQYPLKSTAQLADYIDTIKRELNMSDINEISKETELYIENHDMVDRLREAYEEDKNKLFRNLRDAFLAEHDIDSEDWEVNNRPTGYIKFYRESWQKFEGATSFEYEPHIRLKRNHPHIRLRLDIEHGDKDTIREEFRHRLEDEGSLQELEANDWEVTEGTYGYLAKTIPIDFEQPNESVRDAAQELHQFRDIVEHHIETIVNNHQLD